MITIDEISKLAGVNKSTVSRALSGKSGVSEEKRQLIAETAKKYGYVPDLNASRLRSGAGAGIAVISRTDQPEIGWRRENELVSECRKAFREVHLEKVEENADLDALFARLCAAGCLGFVINGNIGKLSNPVLNALKRRGKMLCLVEDHFPGADSVMADRRSAVAQAMALLLGNNRGRTIFFSGKGKNCGNLQRQKGLEDALTEFPDRKVEKIFLATPDAVEGYERTLEALRKYPDCSALFAYSDTVALGVLKALEKLGKKVPADVSVIGLDDLPFSAFLSPALTTLAQPLTLMAQAAANLLLLRGKDMEHSAREVTLPLTLITRESCK